MKIDKIHTLISKGNFSESSEWAKLRAEAIVAVKSAEWPIGSGTFTIYPESGKKRGQGNGVVPIKRSPMRTLCGDKPTHGKLRLQRQIKDEWVAEVPWPVGARVKPGNVDAAYVSDKGLVCLEWETGNISSSHRSINKICLGLVQGSIRGGVLIVPSMKLAPFLTDRIGNIGELEPYFELWRATPCEEGVFEIFVIEQDAESRDVDRIPKGSDGRALG